MEKTVTALIRFSKNLEAYICMYRQASLFQEVLILNKFHYLSQWEKITMGKKDKLSKECSICNKMGWHILEEIAKILCHYFAHIFTRQNRNLQTVDWIALKSSQRTTKRDQNEHWMWGSVHYLFPTIHLFHPFCTLTVLISNDLEWKYGSGLVFVQIGKCIINMKN